MPDVCSTTNSCYPDRYADRCSAARHAAATRSAISAAEKRARVRGPRTRGSGACRCGASAARQLDRSNGRAERALDPRRAPPRGRRPASRARARRRRAPRARPARSPPARTARATALAALTQSGTAQRVDAAEHQQLGIASPTRARPPGRGASPGARGRRGTGRRGAPGPARAPSARCARSSGRKRSTSTPHGSTCARRRAERSGSSSASERRGRAEHVDEAAAPRASAAACGDACTSVPCSVSARTRAGTASAGHAVSPKWACTTSNGRGRAGLAPSAREDAKRRRSSRAARASSRAPARTRRARRRAPRCRRSAATWSRTKRPRSGAASSGSMFETTSARTIPRP